MDKTERMIELERPPVIETGIIVQVVLPSQSPDAAEDSIRELRQLAWTAGARIAAVFRQYRPRPCPATLIGSGKAAEVKAAVEETGADLVLVDGDLGPAQGAKLEDLLGVKVVDRTQLILHIFGQRAHTNEGKLQVELAQLQYLLPRLTGRGSVMRQQGGVGAIRGPGEQKLEVDRRAIRRRIGRLRGEIEAVRKSRGVQRKRRIEETVGTVALVGYTNAGKSSLLNVLTGADVFVENKLFATLDPRARRCTLPSQREVVFTDTVGFIRNLPHTLVAAFRATLEEVNEADLLLLVADAAHAAVEEQVQAVYRVLEEIGANDRPMIHVFNKTDIADPLEVQRLLYGPGVRCAVSAHTGEGLGELLAEVDRQVAPSRERVTLRIPQNKGHLVARVHASGRVLNQTYEDNTVILEAEIDKALEGLVAEFRSA